MLTSQMLPDISVLKDPGSQNLGNPVSSRSRSVSLHVWGNFSSCNAPTSRLSFYRLGKRSNLLIGSCNQFSREISVNWKLVPSLVHPHHYQTIFCSFNHFSGALSVTCNVTSFSENTLRFSHLVCTYFILFCNANIYISATFTCF